MQASLRPAGTESVFATTRSTAGRVCGFPRSLLQILTRFRGTRNEKQEEEMVRKGGLEPPRSCDRQPLKLVRLPIPPLPHIEPVVSYQFSVISKTQDRPHSARERRHPADQSGPTTSSLRLLAHCRLLLSTVSFHCRLPSADCPLFLGGGRRRRGRLGRRLGGRGLENRT